MDDELRALLYCPDCSVLCRFRSSTVSIDDSSRKVQWTTINQWFGGIFSIDQTRHTRRSIHCHFLPSHSSLFSRRGLADTTIINTATVCETTPLPRVVSIQYFPPTRWTDKDEWTERVDWIRTERRVIVWWTMCVIRFGVSSLAHGPFGCGQSAFVQALQWCMKGRT